MKKTSVFALLFFQNCKNKQITPIFTIGVICLKLSLYKISYYFLIKILILIRKASPKGTACFVIYKERNHKTSLI